MTQTIRRAAVSMPCALIMCGVVSGVAAQVSSRGPQAAMTPGAATTAVAVDSARNSHRAMPGAAPDYLGQQPPGTTAVVFAKGIVSDGHLHGRLAISPDGRDLFWATFSTVDEGQDAVRVTSARVMHAARTADGWTAPEAVLPPDQGMTADPVFSPDGTRLYFRYTPDLTKGWQTGFIERTGQGWSQVQAGGAPFNTSSSFTRSGRVYYTDQLAGKLWNRGIYVADYAGGDYASARALPASINSPFIDYTPHVALDESCLMFSSSRPSAEESMFLYVSFRSPDGIWSEPCRMNEALGFSGNARFPALSPDGAFLFFCGDDGNMYWARSEVLDRLREGCSAPAR
jgi:hypothetical protein